MNSTAGRRHSQASPARWSRTETRGPTLPPITRPESMPPAVASVANPVRYPNRAPHKVNTHRESALRLFEPPGLRRANPLRARRSPESIRYPSCLLPDRTGNYSLIMHGGKNSLHFGNGDYRQKPAKQQEATEE